MPLPEIRDKPALHLPQDRFCLTNPGYTVKPKPVGGSAAQPPALYISCICVSCARSCSTNTLVASVIAHTTAFAAIKAAWTMAKRTNKGLCLCACLCVSVSLWMNSPPPTHTHARTQTAPLPFRACTLRAQDTLEAARKAQMQRRLRAKSGATAMDTADDAMADDFVLDGDDVVADATKKPGPTGSSNSSAAATAARAGASVNASASAKGTPATTATTVTKPTPPPAPPAAAVATGEKKSSESATAATTAPSVATATTGTTAADAQPPKQSQVEGNEKADAKGSDSTPAQPSQAASSKAAPSMGFVSLALCVCVCVCVFDESGGRWNQHRRVTARVCFASSSSDEGWIVSVKEGQR